MAIQPIDLQTMYSQMSNVAQNVAHQQQGVKLAESMQQQNVIQQNKEKAERVQQAAGEEAGVMRIKDGESENTAESEQQKKKKKNEENVDDGQTSSDDGKIRESYIGQHIDITR